MTVEAVRLYSVAAAASRLDVSPDYVYARIRTGEIGVVELGCGRAKQRVRADVLQAFIDSRTYQTTPVPDAPKAGTGVLSSSHREPEPCEANRSTL